MYVAMTWREWKYSDKGEIGVKEVNRQTERRENGWTEGWLEVSIEGVTEWLRASLGTIE